MKGAEHSGTHAGRERLDALDGQIRRERRDELVGSKVHRRALCVRSAKIASDSSMPTHGESAEGANVPTNERLLLLTSPPLDLALPDESRLEVGTFFGMHKSDGTSAGGERAAFARLMIGNATR